MFGFGKKKQELSEQQIVDSKIELRKLMEKLKVMLVREVATARKLKEKGMKSSSNYSKIGVTYYLLQIVQKAYNRLDDLRSSAELSELMGGLSSVIGSINRIGEQTAKPKTSSLLNNLGKMQKSAKSENANLAEMLKGLSVTASEPVENDLSGLVGVDVIERLINGESADTMDIPADAVPITKTVQKTQTTANVQTTEEEFDEVENLRKMQELIDQLP